MMNQATCAVALARRTSSPAGELSSTSGTRRRGPRAVAQARPIGRSASAWVTRCSVTGEAWSGEEERVLLGGVVGEAWSGEEENERGGSCVCEGETTRNYGTLYSSSIHFSQQDSFLYIQFFCTYPFSISSSIHSIHCGTHFSLYLNIFMCDLVLKDLLRRI
jgi:hypothetical protein